MTKIEYLYQRLVKPLYTFPVLCSHGNSGWMKSLCLAPFRQTANASSWLGPPAEDKDIRHFRRIAKELNKDFIDINMTVALVGKPNVGKSSMFNRLVGKKLSLVDKTPGMTRDRLISDDAVLGNYRFTVIDTAGLEGVSSKEPKLDEVALSSQSVASSNALEYKEEDVYRYVYTRMEQQSKQAVLEADIIFFMVDMKDGITKVDKEIARWILSKKSPESVILIANKCDTKASEENLPMVYTLGFGEPVRVSVEQMKGFYDLYARLEQLIPSVLHKPLPKGPSEEGYEQQRIEEIVQRLENEQELSSLSSTAIQNESYETNTQQEEVENVGADVEQVAISQDNIRVAIVGRPNVGKSTLINRLIEEDRLITGAVQGITRDSIPVEWIHRGQHFILTDTAGIRKRSSIQVRMERFSMEAALKTIRKSHVVCVVLDGSQHLTQQDARIIGFAMDSGKPLIIIANKWDLVDKKMDSFQREKLATQLYSMLPDLKGSPIVTLSAIDRTDATVLDTIGNAIQVAFEKWNKRIPTSQLTEWLKTLTSLRPPPAMSSSKKKPKLAYLTQKDTRPPHFVLFGASELPNNYLRFLINGLRNEFDLHGVPIRLRLKGRTED
ncbi:hypothetical protein GAYE_SCF46G5799 [Galdieria yellowstonensis]|uniref:GTPase Der n=1 Tax=Galdieria yellowstonensis TaxID=3028027 RepID=A0AAV9IKX7_9RHOD|nr:hypothetical protein GAYE_SCF46G5799 [Galdieria yellowstonensis]